MGISKLPRSVTKPLGYYVYLHVDPETDKVFYVGKGKGNRALTHLHGKGNAPHDKVVRRLRRRQLQPRVEILIHGLKDERTALAVEMAAINLLGLENLTNEVHGHHSSRQGRMTLGQVRTFYMREPVEVTDPVMLIRIARLFRYDMSARELYEATRSAWRVGERRNKATYALAVNDGIVREVYRISGWFQAGLTFAKDMPRGDKSADRWEFVGIVARDKIRNKYLNRDVTKYLKQASQNPVLYVNC